MTNPNRKVRIAVLLGLFALTMAFMVVGSALGAHPAAAHSLAALVDPTQVPFDDIVTGSTSFSTNYQNYIIAAIIVGLGLIVIRNFVRRPR